jgi:hypothetical protein
MLPSEVIGEISAEYRDGNGAADGDKQQIRARAGGAAFFSRTPTGPQLKFVVSRSCIQARQSNSLYENTEADVAAAEQFPAKKNVLAPRRFQHGGRSVPLFRLALALLIPEHKDGGSCMDEAERRSAADEIAKNLSALEYQAAKRGMYLTVHAINRAKDVLKWESDGDREKALEVELGQGPRTES